MDRTTIEISQQQKGRLDDLKRVDGESYKSVLQMLIAHYNNSQDATESNNESDDGNVDEIVTALKDEISMANEPRVEVDTEQIIKRIEDLENELPRKVAEELR